MAELMGAAMEERRDMQHLNDRLAQYVKKIRDMDSEGPQIDPALYHATLKALEAELGKFKQGCDKELDKLRGQLERAHAEGSKLAAALGKTQANLDDALAKLAEEQRSHRKAFDDVNNLKNALAQNEKEIAALKGALTSRDHELSQLKPANQRLNGEFENAQEDLMHEKKARMELEEALNQAQQKGGFDRKMYEEQIKDLTDRLKTTGSIVVALEKRIKQVTLDDSQNMAGIMQKLRDGNAAELKRYQQEAEANLHKAVSEIKSQQAESDRAQGALQREKDTLDQLARQQAAKIKELESQVASLGQMNKVLKGTLDQERSKAEARMRELERRLRELNDTMMDKVKEFQNAREAQISLRGEIDTYQMLLDEEARRQKNAPSKDGMGSRPMSRAGTPKATININATFGGNRTPAPPTMARSHTTMYDTGSKRGTAMGGSRPMSGTRGRFGGWATTYQTSFPPMSYRGLDGYKSSRQPLKVL